MEIGASVHSALLFRLRVDRRGAALQACAIKHFGIAPLMLAVLLVGSWAHTTNGQIVYHQVAMSGEPVSGDEPEIVFGSFDTPAINNEGRVVFECTVSTPQGGSTRIYVEDGAGFRLIAEQNVQVDGEEAGVVFSDFGWPIPNDAGFVVFEGELQGPGIDSSNNVGIWRTDGGALMTVMREGSTNSGPGPVVTYSGILLGQRHEGQRVSFLTNLSGIGRGIMAGTPDAISVVAKVGDPTPGVLDGEFTAFLVNGSNALHSMNAGGQTVFRATYTGGGYSEARGIWMGSSYADLALIAARDTPAPGVEPGATFTSFGEPNNNNTGQIAFNALIEGDGVGPQNLGIWAGQPGSLQVVVRRHEELDDLPDGVFIDSFPSVWDPVINSQGRTAFAAFLSGAGVDVLNDSSLWVELDDGLTLVAREGNQPPGLSAEFSFGSFVARPLLNSRNQIVFSSRIRGPDLHFENNDTLWISDPSGIPHLVAWDGHDFEVAPGDIRTITSMSWKVNSGGAGEDGRANGLNESGELAFALAFDDGSKAVLVAIACPADLNGDGIVGPVDLATMLGSWGPCDSCPMDFDDDGLVGPLDVVALLSAWGPCL